MEQQPPKTSAEKWLFGVGSSHVAGVMRDVAGLGSTVGYAPFAVGDIIEPTTGWSDVEDSRGGPAYALRGERFRATACCQPPPRPSSARTARPISASVRVAKRGEPAGCTGPSLGSWARRRHRERRAARFPPSLLPPADCDHTRSRQKRERHRGEGPCCFRYISTVFECLMTWHPDDVAS